LKETIDIWKNIMLTQNLSQLTQQIKEQYAGLRSYIVPTEKISLTESGFLNTGKNKFPLSSEASGQLARLFKIPIRVYLKFETDLRALIFKRWFRNCVKDNGIDRDIRIHLYQDGRVIGFDDPKLLRISPVKLMNVVNSSLPENLSSEQISISQFDISANRLHLSCFTPEIVAEPRPGDYINGGIDIIHYIAGDLGTQIHCYIRRIICSNGAITHVCNDERQIRARRLHNGQFDEEDMLGQIDRLLTEAWKQLDAKLNVVTSLLDKEKISVDFLRQQRTRFSLNNRILQLIEEAIRQDEIGPTNTQYDWFNALSRVATHDELLSFRQRRTLSRMAGEFSQYTAHQCSQCGSWIMT
jgi:hypothetical protein